MLLQAISIPGQPPLISNNAQRNPPIPDGVQVNSKGAVFPGVNLYHISRLGGVEKQEGKTVELLIAEPGQLKSTLLQTCTALAQLIPGLINPSVELMQREKLPSLTSAVTENQICVPVAIFNAADT